VAWAIGTQDIASHLGYKILIKCDEIIATRKLQIPPLDLLTQIDNKKQEFLKVSYIKSTLLCIVEQISQPQTLASHDPTKKKVFKSTLRRHRLGDEY
jgi:hypothetical protein